MRASHWQDYASGEEIVKEGEMDDRFYIIVVRSSCAVERHRSSASGCCRAANASARPATCRAPNAPPPFVAADDVTVLKVSSTLLEQVSASCQLRFNRYVPALADRAPADQRGAPLACTSAHSRFGRAPAERRGSTRRGEPLFARQSAAVSVVPTPCSSRGSRRRRLGRRCLREAACSAGGPVCCILAAGTVPWGGPPDAPARARDQRRLHRY
jgi:hypothetical protein